MENDSTRSKWHATGVGKTGRKMAANALYSVDFRDAASTTIYCQPFSITSVPLLVSGEASVRNLEVGSPAFL